MFIHNNINVFRIIKKSFSSGIYIQCQAIHLEFQLQENICQISDDNDLEFEPRAGLQEATLELRPPAEQQELRQLAALVLLEVEP